MSDNIDGINDPFDISDDVAVWFEDLSDERRELMRIRYTRQIEDVYDDDDQLTIFSDMLKSMFLQDVMDKLVKDGLIETGDVNEDGEIQYRLSDETRAIVEQHQDD